MGGPKPGGRTQTRTYNNSHPYAVYPKTASHSGGTILYKILYAHIPGVRECLPCAVRYLKCNRGNCRARIAIIKASYITVVYIYIYILDITYRYIAYYNALIIHYYAII